ncbi:interleukin-21 receptor [Pelobates fuscus]|uniref:interleukin-21 receptor n=1 Tax=Pelobates fuscus TaxID=191477 RepID=UPI002FE47FE1
MNCQNGQSEERSHHKITMNRKTANYIAPLLLLLCSAVLFTNACEDFRCTVDYINTLTCNVYKEKEKRMNISYQLSARWILKDLEEEDSCEFIQLNNQQEYICNLSMDLVGADDTYWISVNKTVFGENISSECGPFFFRKTIRPRAPFNLTVSIYETYYNMSWNTDYESLEYMFLHGEMGYELNYKKQKDTWKNPKSIHILEDDKNVVLLTATFDNNEDYVARVRAKPRNGSIYNGLWSEWSPSVKWSTQTDVSEGFWRSVEMKVILGIGAFVAFILILMPLKLPQKLWKTLCGLVPNPEPFFKPLYLGHNGDFKSWLGSSNYTTGLHFEGGLVLPDFVEIYSQTLFKHVSKTSLRDMENHEKLLPKTCCNLHSHDCRKCRFSSCTRSQSIEHAPIDTVTVTDEGSLCCPHCFSSNISPNNAHNDTEEINSDDGYPPVNMDSSNENLPSPLVTRQSNTEVPSNSSEEHGLCSMENLMKDKVNILDFISIPDEEWKMQDSLSPDDENLFYIAERYHSFSPSSGNSEEFRFREICIDMDTIDSGYVDSECGSPVESEFGNNDLSPKISSSESYHQDEECRTNYVKQWVPSN